jgi:uncharacterized protein YggE
MPRLSRTRAALTVATASLACAAPAAAQTPAQPAAAPNTITVNGTGAAKPTPAVRNSNASIVAAVERAQNAATPLALVDGRARAAKLAQLSGLALGPLLAIAETSPSPYGVFGPFGQIGSFGPGEYCGTVRRPIYRRTKQGRRRRVGIRTRRVCRVPPQVSANLAMTFGAAPPPPA